jgi:hypothetical protein
VTQALPELQARLKAKRKERTKTKAAPDREPALTIINIVL